MIANSNLNYFAIEPARLTTEIIQALRHGELARWPASIRTIPGIRFCKNAAIRSFRIVLNCQFLNSLEQLDKSPSQFDAIFHDPFSPEVAPDLWNENYFRMLHQLLKPSRRLVTYCVKSKIQKLLREIGFTVEKTRGPIGGKREVLVATK